MEQKKMLNEIYLGLLLVVFSLIVIFVLIPDQIQLASTFGSEIGVNSRTFPYFAAVVIGATAVIHLLSSSVKYMKLRREYGKADVTKDKSEIRSEVVTGLMFLVFAAYAVAFNVFGFIPASIVIPPIALYVVGSKNIWHYVSVYLFIIVIFVAFQYFLKIQLI